jgi:hypothetical protein
VLDSVGMLTKLVVWESDTVRLVKVDGFRRHPNFPFGRRGRDGGCFRQKPGRTIEKVMLHSLAGPFRRGEDTVHGLARYHSAEPKRDAEGHVIGGGRGWPGPAYHYLVPYYPAVEDGRFVVYQLWDPSWITWCAGPYWNPRTVSVGLGGMHDTRHAPKYSAGQARDPDPGQFDAMRGLCLDYLLPAFELDEDDLLPHAWAGKPACPGDVVEAWVCSLLGKPHGWLSQERKLWLPHDERFAAVAATKPDRRPLDTWKQRQAALVELGLDVGESGVDGLFGYDTKSAVVAFQRCGGLVVDGVWGGQTEAAVRLALGARIAPAGPPR